jgi:membrane-bound metal-dependent hydrolase YbcI (DUF457 family)
MFVGHGLAAFGLVAGGARVFGCSRGRALSLGASAGAFATIPDVDILYAPMGVLGANSALGATEQFWAAGNLIHRAVTHSLVVGSVAALAFWLWSRAGEWLGEWDVSAERGVALLLLAGLTAVAGVVSGPLGAFVMGAFALAGLAVTEGTMRYGDLAPKAVILTALVGLLSHPFGDLFTGEPPAMLYPFDVRLVTERIVLSTDPTLNLLGAFWLELATIWLAAVVYCWLTRRRLRRYIHGRAALGLAYAAAALAVPAPTLASSYQFVFSVLAVGVVGPAPLVRRHGARRPHRTADDDGVLAALLTGLAASTLASVAYALVYIGV